MPQLRTYIVEDSAVIRENLTATLQELVPLAVVGSTGEASAAGQWLAQPGHTIDLLIIDLFLTGGSGLDVLRAAQRLQPACTRVVLSRHVTPALRRQCLAWGAHQVFDATTEIDAMLAYCGELASATGAAGAPA